MMFCREKSLIIGSRTRHYALLGSALREACAVASASQTAFPGRSRASGGSRLVFPGNTVDDYDKVVKALNS